MTASASMSVDSTKADWERWRRNKARFAETLNQLADDGFYVTQVIAGNGGWTIGASDVGVFLPRKDGP